MLHRYDSTVTHSSTLCSTIDSHYTSFRITNVSVESWIDDIDYYTNEINICNLIVSNLIQNTYMSIGCSMVINEKREIGIG